MVVVVGVVEGDGSGGVGGVEFLRLVDVDGFM